MSIVLQPASGRRSQENYAESIQKTRSLGEILPLVSDQVGEALRAIYSDGGARLWGAVPGDRNSPNFERMSAGDLVLFYRKPKNGYARFYSALPITLKTNAPRLALKVWGKKDETKTWSHIFFLGDPVEIDIPYSNAWSVFREGPSEMLRGLTVLSESQSQEFLNAFPELLGQDPLVSEFHQEMLRLYQETGEATGYWAFRFLASIRKKGGLAEAKRLLEPGKQTSDGFAKLVDARRADLTVEELALSERFSVLFTTEELKEARRRLQTLPDNAFPLSSYPDEVDQEIQGTDQETLEGKVKRVTVNQYERDRKARDKCVRHYGARCAVCGTDFGERYGEVGEGFIHVHHLTPIASVGEQYIVDPINDLIPVCPNCHAMLHRTTPPLTVSDLKSRLQ